MGPSYYSSPFACPEGAPDTEAGRNPQQLPQWIAYNIFLGWDNANPSDIATSSGSYTGAYRRVRLSKVRQPQVTLMFGDGYRSAVQSATVRSDYILSLGPVQTEAGHGNMTKHQGTANYVMIDGHTENLSEADAQFRADAGRTGAAWRTEYFFLPFPASNRIR